MLLDIAVVKAKQTVQFDTGDIPDDLIPEIYALGLKQLINRGMTDVTAKEIPDKEELQAAAMEVALKNIEKIKAGEIRRTAGTKAASKGETKEVQAEARKEAQLAVKSALKKKGHKVSLIASKEITRLTNDLLKSEQGKEIWERAKAVVEARKAKAAEQPEIGIDLTGVKEDPKLVAKNDGKKAKGRKPGAKARGKGKGAAQVEANA